MSGLWQLYLDQFLVFVLVLTRVSGLVMTAPIFGSRNVPLRIRALLAVGLSLIITPLHWGQPPPPPNSVVELSAMLGREAVLGLALGLAVRILFAGFQLTGQLIGQMSGMSLADVFDPSFDQSVPVFSQLLDVVALSLFLAMGGHRQVMRAFLDTFQWRPPGADDLPPNMVQALSDVMHESFLVGIRAGAPVVVTLLLSILILGLISRTLPQLNVIAVGFSLNAMIMLVTLALSLAALAWVLEDHAQVVIETVRAALLQVGP